MNEQDNLIPRRLDDKPKFFIWELEQIGIAVLCLCIGTLGNSMFSGLLMGVLLSYVYSRMRSGHHSHYSVHAMYWYLPEYMMRMKKLPPSHFNELS